MNIPAYVTLLSRLLETMVIERRFRIGWNTHSEGYPEESQC